jgi:hypothetical protein
VIALPLGTLRIKGRALPTTRFPPLLPDMAAPPLRATVAATSVRGVTPLSPVPSACTCHHTSGRVGGARERPGGIATPKLHPSLLTLAPFTGRSTPLTFAGRGLTDGHFHLGVIALPLGTLRIKVRALPTARFPSLLPDVAVPLVRAMEAATSVRGVTPRSPVPGASTRLRVDPTRPFPPSRCRRRRRP